MEPQTYRVKLSDGREFDVSTEGGPPDEASIMASLGAGAPPPAPSSQLENDPRYLSHDLKDDPLVRFGSGAVNAIKGMAGMAAKASGIPGLFRGGALGAIKDQFEVAKNVFYDPPAAMFEKARTAETLPKQAAYAAAGAVPLVGPMVAHGAEEVAAGRAPELMGELVAGVAVPVGVARGSRAAVSGAREALATRTAAKVPARVASADSSLRLAFPKADLEAIQTARPYLNEQLGGKAPANTAELLEALNKASSGIETKVRGILEEFKYDQIDPQVSAAVRKQLEGHPRSDFAAQGLKELEGFDIDKPRSPVAWDEIRNQLNAENQSVMERTGSKRATARKTDPGFAAREVAVRQIREKLYGHLERRGVPGVDALRRDQGAVIKFRDAVAKQAQRGPNKVAGSAPQSGARQALATMIDKFAPGPGIVTQPIAGMIRGGASTRDALVSRAFGVGDERMPTYPTVPARPTIAGELGPGAITPKPAPVGEMIEPTLPENYGKPAVDNVFGESVATAAPTAERAFILKWLADELRDQAYQPGNRMRGMAGLDEATNRAAGEKSLAYTGRVAGTPIQEMFHELGIKGTRPEIADQLERAMRGGRVNPKIDKLADAMRQAWDGQRFDFELLSDDVMADLGVGVRSMRSPVTTPHPGDFPGVHERFFPKDRNMDLPDVVADPEAAAATRATGEATSAAYAEQSVKELVAERLGIDAGELTLPSNQWRAIKAAAEDGDWDLARSLLERAKK